MQAIQSMRICSPLIKSSPVVRIAVRNAGGGGRPGARPTFNWKERKALKLDGSVKKEFKARPIGFNFGELNEHFDPSRGDIEVNITNLSDWTEPEISVTNNYKVVDVTRLYGSSKPCGPLVVPRKEYTGRFQRVYKSKGLVV